MSEEKKHKSQHPSHSKGKDHPFSSTPHGASLIGGDGLLGLLESLTMGLARHHGMDPDLPEDEDDGLSGAFDVLGDQDFDGGDPTVEQFKKEMGGCPGVVKVIRLDGPEALDKVTAMMKTLSNTRLAYRAKTLRQAYSAIHAARKGNGAQQYQAVQILERLASDTLDTNELKNLVKAREAVLSGTEESLDAAAYRVKSAYVSVTPPENIRTAYTTLATQDGEGYLLCPKAKKIFGYAIPMEVSKCRDNCIDSRTSPEGKVSCAYAGWLRNVADSHQNAVEARLEVHRHPDNEANLLTLREGERSKPLTKDERPWEQRLDEDAKNRNKKEDADGKKNDSIETKLDKNKKVNWGHQGEEPERLQDKLSKEKDAKYEGANEDSPKVKNPEKYEGAKRSASTGEDKIDPSKDDNLGKQLEKGHQDNDNDEVIEKLLDDERSGLSEDDLDCLLDEWLAKERVEK